MSTIKAIIPCAGFGTRVNMRPDQSKELNHYNGKPLIEYCLDVCALYGLTPHVITRKEKTDLIDYCVSRNITVQILEQPGAEWADTVLKSFPYWSEHNVFMLPDTIWENISVIEQLLRDLELGCNASFGVHAVNNQSQWSVINNYYICEKPNVKGNGIAWGLFAFKKKYGKILFTLFTQKNHQMKLNKCSFHSLVNFRDVTRGSTIGI
jgi:dTDP-glucose pyrophosphorylase